MNYRPACSLVATTVAITVAAALPATAVASTPQVGAVCSANEASTTRNTPGGTRVVCVYVRSGRYQWQRLSDPSPMR